MRDLMLLHCRIPTLAALLIGGAITSGPAQVGSLPTGFPSDPSAAPSLRAERLVPAAMNVITDKQGNSWNIEQNGTLGRVGNSMINSGLTLLINNQQFYANQPMMTADGGEFVLLNRASSSLPGLQALRRIKVLEREGALRYLEVLTNSNSNALTVSLVLRTNFSGNYKTYLTDQGNSGVVTLGPRESAILVTPGSNQSNRAFLFTLSGPKSPVKPTISSQNKYGLTFQYNLTIPPGQTVAIAHAVAQVPVPREFDRQSLARVFRPVAIERLVSTMAKEFRPLLANADGTGDLSGGAILGGVSVEDLGVNRGRRDTLAIGEKTRLVGTATLARLKVTNSFGEAEPALDQIAAIAGGNRGRRDGARIFLRDGQVFSGEVTTEDLRFAMTSGGRMNLQIDSLDRLVMAKDDADGQWGNDTAAIVETLGGDRIAVTRDESVPIHLAGMTPWGEVKFTLDDIFWLAPMEDEPVGHFVEFKNGTRCFLFLTDSELPLPTKLFGTSRIDARQIRSVVTRAAMDRTRDSEKGSAAPAEAAAHPLSPHVTAAGGQRIVGAITTDGLHVVTQGEAVPVTPQEIRRMINVTAADGLASDASGPYFRLELWGGGVLAGYLAETELAMEVRGVSWRLPLSDLREMVTPVPRLSEGAQDDIAKLLKELGNDSWQRREKATEDLRGFGYLAQSILQEELKTNPDPEVRRRIERILAGIE